MNFSDYSADDNGVWESSEIEQELRERRSAIEAIITNDSATMSADMESRINDAISEINSQLIAAFDEKRVNRMPGKVETSATNPGANLKVTRLEAELSRLRAELRIERERTKFLEKEIRDTSSKLFKGEYSIRPSADLHRSNLAGAYLRWADLTGADLSDAVLSGADLGWADLRVAILRGADLRNSILRNSILRGAILTGADLTGADLTGADLTGAYLNGANLTGTVMPDGFVHD